MVAKRTILVAGGAGFIGSHVDKYLRNSGYNTVLLDNLSRSRALPCPHPHFVHADVGSRTALDALFSSMSIDAVMHFAAFIDVGESVRNPACYYRNNVCQTIELLEAMCAHGVDTLIFSSTAAVYGVPKQDRIDETHPLQPINPYGHSKRMAEQIIQDFSRSHPLKYCCLRYFNAAGGDPSGEIKNQQSKATNLIPLALAALKEKASPLTIYGTDYATRDGTCVRDYIHVYDLAQAHVLGMEALFNGASSGIYNLGNSQGFTVREVLAAIERVTNKAVPVLEGSRRPGDPPALIANSRRAHRELGWSPLYAELDQIILDAWTGLK